MNNTPAQFKDKQMEELSSSIANATITLPITEYEQLKADAEKYKYVKDNFVRSSLQMGGNHYWRFVANSLRGLNFDEAIDQAMGEKNAP
jgi:hypothetical protein